MPSGIVGKDWRNDLDIKNSSKIMIILAGDRKVFREIHLWWSSRAQISCQERINKLKNQVTTISEFGYKRIDMLVSYV